MTFLAVALAWVMAAWVALGVLGAPFIIGKPRKPATPRTALVVMLAGSVIVALLVTFALTFPV